MNSTHQLENMTVRNDSGSPLSRQHIVSNATQYLGLPLVVTFVLMVTSINNNSLIQIVLAFVLFLIPWVAYQQWRDNNAFGLPIFALISGLHWLYFAVALFWGDRISPVWYSSTTLVSEESITKTLLMVVLGVLSIGLGMSAGFTRLSSPRQSEPMAFTSGMWDYVRVVLLMGVFASLFPTIVYALGEEGRQWIIAAQTTVPLFAFLLLLRRYFRNEAILVDKILILFYIGVRVMTGLGSGWSGSVFYLGIAVGLVYFLERRRIPVRALLVVVVITLFLQPGKSDFRQSFWYTEDYQGDLVTRMGYWLDQSQQKWQEAFSDPSGQKLLTYLRGSMLRVSLLTNAATVHDKTPSDVPYQGAQLYGFAVAGLIPRFMWPDKPSGSAANQFYQVAYGVTQESRLGNVSIAIGFLTESYISFGWIGVLVIMFILGMFFRGIHDSFFQNPASVLAPALGTLTVLSLISVETQMGLYLVTTIQTIVVGYGVLIPIIRHKQLRVLERNQAT